MNKGLRLDEYQNSLQAYPCVYIFGAGKVARIVMGLCLDVGVQIKGFIVSDLNNNPASLQGVRVYQYDEMDLKYNIPILIAVMERGDKKIQKILKHLQQITLIF